MQQNILQEKELLKDHGILEYEFTHLRKNVDYSECDRLVEDDLNLIERAGIHIYAIKKF